MTETIAELSRRLALSQLRLQLAVAELKTEASRLALLYQRQAVREERRAGRDSGDHNDAGETVQALTTYYNRNRAELAACQERLAAALAEKSPEEQP